MDHEALARPNLTVGVLPNPGPVKFDCPVRWIIKAVGRYQDHGFRFDLGDYIVEQGQEARPITAEAKGRVESRAWTNRTVESLVLMFQQDLADQVYQRFGDKSAVLAVDGSCQVNGNPEGDFEIKVLVLGVVPVKPEQRIPGDEVPTWTWTGPP